MAIFDLFSTRRKQAENAGKADVYRYDGISHALRVQIAHILRDGMGEYESYGSEPVSERWEFVHDAIAREKGLFELGSERSFDVRCINWFLDAPTTDDALDFIELTFRVLERAVDNVSGHDRHIQQIKVNSEEAIDELNTRFKQHAIGYQYTNGQVVRLDSQYVHAEVTKPALSLLRGKAFDTANEEFLAAHRHYRNGENKESIVACQRAFESTLKAICTIKRWPFAKGDRLPELLKIARSKGLFPDYLDTGFDTYIAMLKTGLPGVRNSAGGHGQEPRAPRVPNYVASYALHMTATNILLVCEAAKD